MRSKQARLLAIVGNQKNGLQAMPDQQKKQITLDKQARVVTVTYTLTDDDTDREECDQQVEAALIRIRDRVMAERQAHV